MKAADHPLQDARVAALRDYDILDTPQESDFDDIAKLASAICGAPISVVNLIDADRQFFKAEVGLGVRETPLDNSICGHVILEHDFVEIEDTHEDSRLQDNPLCTPEAGLRFYAGAILRTADDLPIGTLCVLDYRPRRLSPFQRDAIVVLARQVMTQLDLRRALKMQVMMRNEIDHRVKNSLLSVSALVRLERSRSTDATLSAALDAVGQRVDTIALVHQELHRPGAGDDVDLGNYIGKLSDLLRRIAPASVEVRAEIEHVSVPARLVAPVGMIVSEFVMNSIKHAFPDGRPGRVAITVTERANGEVALLCEDDGVGFGEPAEGAPIGLGLRIIDASVAQLRGRAEKPRSESGVRLQVVFPLVRKTN